MASFSLYMPTEVSTLGELYRTLWSKGVTSLFTTHLTPTDSEVSHLPHTTIWQIQTDLYHLLGQATPILGL
jgi:hypothetical protein